MPESRTAEFSFMVPDDWKDRRVIAWSAQPRPGQAVVPNVLATYDRLPEGRTLEAFVDGQADDLAKQARRFTLIGRRDVLLDGRRGIEIVFRWDAGSGLLRQRQIYVGLDDGRVITLANTALDEEFDANEPVFGAMLSGFRWVSAGTAD